MYDGCDREWIPPLMLVNSVLDKMSSLNSCHVRLRPIFSLPMNVKLHIIRVALMKSLYVRTYIIELLGLFKTCSIERVI